MHYLTQDWQERSLLNGSFEYLLLMHDEYSVIYDDSLWGFSGIVTAFADEVLDIMGCLEGDWRREFDEVYDEGYESSFLIFRELYKEFGIGMMIYS